jgi:hypothetical protein
VRRIKDLEEFWWCGWANHAIIARWNHPAREGGMMVGRFVAWLFLGIAVFSFGWAVIDSFDAGAFRIGALGEQWFRLHKGSLGLLQAGTQRHIAPWLWDPVLQTILLWPGWLVFGVFWLVLRRLFRRKRKNRWFIS